MAAAEGVAYDDSGLDAIVFTADGDMRQGINNLQATQAGFGFVNQARARSSRPHAAAASAAADPDPFSLRRRPPHPCLASCVGCVPRLVWPPRRASLLERDTDTPGPESPP